jgi:hypothetical protein
MEHSGGRLRRRRGTEATPALFSGSALRLNWRPIGAKRFRRSPDGRPDDIEMYCLSFRRRRARGLLPVGKRLLCAGAGSADRLGRSGLTPDGDR